MDNIRVVVVDDENLARQRIRRLITDFPDMQIVDECGDGESAVKAVRKHRPDLLFLDVRMPGMDGFGVLDSLEPELIPVTIFVTAYDQYALKAFEAQAIDFLLKPFDRERFGKAVDRARQYLSRNNGHDLRDRVMSLLTELKAPVKSQNDRLVVKSAGKVFFVPYDDIDYIEAAGNYLKLHVGDMEHLIRETMTNVEGKLDSEKFVRIHRSAIVNISRIKELQSMFHGDFVVVLKSGTELPLSRGYRERVQQRLGIPI